ncbi:hypothetical protein F5B21DRAFT_499054 [Xylaria acuta]|nr:hypothetical protein F5B21DRAFT_499054 [Xylaria acuta]
MFFKIGELVDRRLVGNAIEQFSQGLQLSTERRPNRSMAIEDLNIMEPKVVKLIETHPPPPCPELQRADWIAALRASVTVSEKGQRLRHCFWYVADAIELPPDNVNIPEKCRIFSGNTEISRHFERNHVRLIGKS